MGSTLSRATDFGSSPVRIWGSTLWGSTLWESTLFGPRILDLVKYVSGGLRNCPKERFSTIEVFQHMYWKLKIIAGNKQSTGPNKLLEIKNNSGIRGVYADYPKDP